MSRVGGMNRGGGGGGGESSCCLTPLFVRQRPWNSRPRGMGYGTFVVGRRAMFQLCFRTFPLAG